MKRKHLINTSASAQRNRLLEALQILGAVNTLYARDRLNIMAPASRIKELRKEGHQILTDLITITDRNGFVHHKVARYVLVKVARGKCIAPMFDGKLAASMESEGKVEVFIPAPSPQQGQTQRPAI